MVIINPSLGDKLVVSKTDSMLLAYEDQPGSSSGQYHLLSVQYNFIAKCQYNRARNVLWCQVHSPHFHSSHKTALNYNSRQTGKKSLINKYMRNPTGIKRLCISVIHIQIVSSRGQPLRKLLTVRIKAVIQIIYNKLIN